MAGFKAFRSHCLLWSKRYGFAAPHLEQAPATAGRKGHEIVTRGVPPGIYLPTNLSALVTSEKLF